MDEVYGIQMSQFQVGKEDLKSDQVPDKVSIMLLSVKSDLCQVSFEAYLYVISQLC